MKGVLILLLCYCAGELLSRFSMGFIPGSVLGMIILFGVLQAGIVKKEDVCQVCTFLLDNMLLFFIPVSVGVVVSFGYFRDDLLSISVILVVSTVIVLAVAGVLQQKLGRK